jgi:hypothetical protein
VATNLADVLQLINQLNDLVHKAKAVPLTDQVRIDREEVSDLLDQIRVSVVALAKNGNNEGWGSGGL